MSTNYLFKQTVKNGSVITLAEALTGLVDEKGNNITFDSADFPDFYYENTDYAYSLEGVQNMPVTLRIRKLTGEEYLMQPTVTEERQYKEEGSLNPTSVKITSKTRQK